MHLNVHYIRAANGYGAARMQPSPTPTPPTHKKSIQKKHTRCEHDDIKGFTVFALRLKSYTKFG